MVAKSISILTRFRGVKTFLINLRRAGFMLLVRPLWKTTFFTIIIKILDFLLKSKTLSSDNNQTWKTYRQLHDTSHWEKRQNKQWNACQLKAAGKNLTFFIIYKFLSLQWNLLLWKETMAFRLHITVRITLSLPLFVHYFHHKVFK